MAARTCFCLIPAMVVLVVFVGCSGSGGGPQVGTPEWYWMAAGETFQQADFTKTQEHLGHLVDSENPWRTKATAWRVVVLTGLSRGFMEIANAYAEGAEENEAQAQDFQLPIQQYRRDARQYAIDLAESLGTIKEVLGPLPSVPLDFPFPAGTPNPSPVMATLSGGTIPLENQVIEGVTETLKRGILLQTTRFAGAGEAVNEARMDFETAPVEVPTTQFFLVLGESMYDLSELFNRKQLNEPQIRKIIMERAVECIGQALESDNEDWKKAAEELKEEIEEEQEKLKV